MIEYKKATIDGVPVKDKVVLLRVDFNAPMDRGRITDDSRIVASVSTIQDLLDRGAKQVILLSHLGRPKGVDESLSLLPIKNHLQALLGQKVGFSSPNLDFNSSERVVLCENLRFWPGEADNDPQFARDLVTATSADIFVQDGFSVCHRASATVEAITKILPAYASRALAQEYTAIREFIEKAPRPLVAVLGGAKISDKIGFVKKIVLLADQIFIGGALGTTFLREAGKPVGSSLVEYDQSEVVAEVNEIAKKERKALFLPSDVRTAESADSLRASNKLVDAVLGRDQILDIGQSSSMVLEQLISNASAVIWNGPVGYAENPAFAEGSLAILRALTSTHVPALIGGGDTLAFFKKERANLQYDGLILSTGGGAMLDLLADGHLVGIDSLLDA